MLKLSNFLVDTPILSLRSGTIIAQTIKPIINPDNLKIEGFYCKDNAVRNHILNLLVQDIREVDLQGFIVNDHDVLAETEDLVRLQKIISLNYAMIGKKVVTSGGKKVGIVGDYAVDMDSMYIKKIYVEPSLIKGLFEGQLSVDRSQIIEVTDTKIVIRDPLESVSSQAALITQNNL